jgi:oligopeptide/dipeptide ABC transporter ATP-binding protein
MRAIRGRHIAMVFQEPMTALNPVMRIGDQIAEGPKYHLRMGNREALRHAEDLLKQVGIPDAAKRLRDYPHQFSGGMRQRVVIAIAMSCRPEIIIADEPTTALDVTVQSQILDLLSGLARQTRTSLLLITHNLGIVARYADRVNVMYAGKIVETASGDIILQEPKHPYTKALLQCVPRIDRLDTDLASMPGSVPGPGERLAGCSFRPRCPDATPQCTEGAPSLVTLTDGHQCACFVVKK